MLTLMKNLIIKLTAKSIWTRRLLRRILIIKNRSFYALYFFNKVDDKLIVFESYMGRSYACSPRALYEEMLDNPDFKDYKFIWALKKPWEKQHVLNDERTTIVKYKSRKYYKAYSQAKYWITNSMLPQALVKKEGQCYIQCWHGTPLKRLRCDIVPETKSAKNTIEEIITNNDQDARRFDYFLSPSRFASEKFISAFNLKKLNKEDIIVEVGYPRNDYLYNYKKEDVQRIKTELGIPDSKKVILYAPTFRDDQHTIGVGYTYKTDVDFDYLKEKLEKDFVILFRAHYFVANNFDFEKYEGFIYDVSKIDDINELYIISDVLITDYSSVFFDYANLKKPMLFHMYDLDYYATQLRGFYIDLEELPGDIVKSENEIINILNDLEKYNAKHMKKYTLFNNKFNYLDDGKVSKKFVEKVF